VIIAGGVGSFQPRKLDVPGAAELEGKQVHYKVRDPQSYAGKDIVILGGGDSALDWALALVDIANSVVVVHRRPEFRGAPASVAKLMALRDEHRADVLVGQVKDLVLEDGSLKAVRVRAGTASCARSTRAGAGVLRAVAEARDPSPSGASSSTRSS
jgi:thioredoxin reductase (NADPH)